MIGAEARQFRYRTEEGAASVALGWHSRDHNDGYWPLITYTFGPYWRASRPFKRGQTPQELADLIAGEAAARNDSAFRWQDVSYSQEFGQPGTEEWGGSHGVGDSFLCLDAADENEACVRYLYTNVRAPGDGRWVLHFGAGSGEVEQVWLNGNPLLAGGPEAPAAGTVEVALQKGVNHLLLACIQPRAQHLRAYAALLEPGTVPVRDRAAARLTWFAKPTELVYDIAPDRAASVGWYRFEAPAGTHTLHLDLDAGRVQVWVNGEAVDFQGGQVRLDAPLSEVSQVALCVEHRAGAYAGAAVRRPVRFECASASLPLGDWSQHALESYSGGAVYTKGFTLASEQLRGDVILDPRRGEHNRRSGRQRAERGRRIGESLPLRHHRIRARGRQRTGGDRIQYPWQTISAPGLMSLTMSFPGRRSPGYLARLRLLSRRVSPWRLDPIGQRAVDSGRCNE